MKILLYNIDHGGKVGEHSFARWPALAKTIKQVDPDILVLLECWDWRQENEFKKFARKIGYPYYYLSTSNTKHHLGLLSKIKPKKIIKLKKGFHHSVLQAKFDSSKIFTLFGIHLSPKSEDIRLKEINQIIKLAKTAEPVIIMGDFNSLSPFDCYHEKKLISQFKKENITKFGKNKIEYRVIKKLLKSGLIDIYKNQHQGKGLHCSVPSKCCQDKDHSAKMRLDYAFISKSLIKNIQSSKIIKNKFSNRSSDHYPLLLKLK